MIEKNRRPEDVQEPRQGQADEGREERADHEQQGELPARDTPPKMSLEEHLAGLWCALGLGD